ncbi:enolase-phosphatase E1-like [Haliotis cracherodii]|uniref:enolase-phosphatase E1-like n=1 Tax=Haliotis cracherodii TaxID=6455 RepID=UPI0039E80E0E
MSRSILKKSSPMRVPRDDVQEKTKEEETKSEEKPCQSAREEAEAAASIPDPGFSSESRKDEPKKPFKNKNLKAKDSMRLSSNRLGSSPRSRFLQKRKESSSSPRLLKIKEGENTFTFPESASVNSTKVSGDAPGKDTGDRTSGKDILQRTLKESSLERTLGVDAVHRKDTVDRTSRENAVDRTVRENTVDRTVRENTVDSTSRKDTVDSTSREDTVDRTFREDTVDSTSREDTVDSTSREDIVDSTSREDTVDSTSREDTVDRTPREDIVERTSRGDIVHITSGTDIEDKTSWEYTAHRPSRSDQSGHVHVPVHLEKNRKANPHLHTRIDSAVTKSPNIASDVIPDKSQIEEQKVDAALGGGGTGNEVFIRKSQDVVAEDQDRSTHGDLAGGPRDLCEVDIPDSIVCESDNSSHVESGKYLKDTMGVHAVPSTCPSPRDKIDVEVLPTYDPSPAHTLDVQDRPAVDPSPTDNENVPDLVIAGPTTDSIVGDLPKVDINPQATLNEQHIDNVEGLLAGVSIPKETVEVPDDPSTVPSPSDTEEVQVLPTTVPISQDTEEVQVFPTLDPIPKDAVEEEDQSQTDPTSENSSGDVNNLHKGTDRCCYKHDRISDTSFRMDMDKGVSEESEVERSQHGECNMDHGKAAHNNDVWSFSDDESLV